MSTLMGYVLGRAAVRSEQGRAKAAEAFTDILTGYPGEQGLLAELEKLRAENANLRQIARTNKAIAEQNHASALSWLEHAAELEQKLETAQRALGQI